MITQRISLSAQDINKVSSTQLHKLGTISETADGRVYRYASAGSTNLAAGKVTIAQAKVANHTAVAVAANANVGDTQVTVTLGATAATADQYKDGFLVIVDGAGVGQTLRVTGHAANAGSAALVVSLADPLVTALSSSTSKASLVYNPYSGAAISSAAAALAVTGVPTLAVAGSSFYWSQTGGTASVLSDGIITKGAGAIVSASVNGAATIELAATVTQRIGYAPEATVDTKYYPIVLTVVD